MLTGSTRSFVNSITLVLCGRNDTETMHTHQLYRSTGLNCFEILMWIMVKKAKISLFFMALYVLFNLFTPILCPLLQTFNILAGEWSEIAGLLKFRNGIVIDRQRQRQRQHQRKIKRLSIEYRVMA